MLPDGGGTTAAAGRGHVSPDACGSDSVAAAASFSMTARLWCRHSVSRGRGRKSAKASIRGHTWVGGVIGR